MEDHYFAILRILAVVFFIGFIIFMLLKLFKFKIEDKIEEKNREDRERIVAIMEKASNKPLNEAVKLLGYACITWGIDCNDLVNHFNLPKIFWAVRNESLQARTLLTLLTHIRGESEYEYENAQLSLAELMVEQALKTPGTVIAIACEITRQASGQVIATLLRNFHHL